MGKCRICGLPTEELSTFCDECIEKTKNSQLIYCVKCKEVWALARLEPGDNASVFIGPRAILFSKKCKFCAPDKTIEELTSVLYTSEEQASKSTLEN